MVKEGRRRVDRKYFGGGAGNFFNHPTTLKFFGTLPTKCSSTHPKTVLQHHHPNFQKKFVTSCQRFFTTPPSEIFCCPIPPKLCHPIPKGLFQPTPKICHLFPQKIMPPDPQNIATYPSRTFWHLTFEKKSCHPIPKSLPPYPLP